MDRGARKIYIVNILLMTIAKLLFLYPIKVCGKTVGLHV